MSDTHNLLIEIGTEELPPKVLADLAKEFHDRLTGYFFDLLAGDAKTHFYYSPRRFAVIIENLPVQQPNQEVERFGPSVKIAYDEQGKPTKAAEGFANSCKLPLDKIGEKDGKLYAAYTQEGKLTIELIPDAINSALDKLPIPKRMRWGNNQQEFVRPVHWVVVLFGNEVVSCEILGVESGNKTYGHRFHHPEAIELKNPDEYFSKLKQARVWVNDPAHGIQMEISKQVQKLAKKDNGQALNSDSDSSLVAEVAALVEWPHALKGNFDKKYLELPEELLISVLEEQQRYFPIRDNKTQKLLPCFIAVSNIESKDEKQVIKGNERVIVPRLSDAMFFWETDKAKPLACRLEELNGVTFQKKLGTIGDKTGRVVRLAESIAQKLGTDTAQVSRAAMLSKCDLVTDLVGEFPELQGIVGRYLAHNDQESDEVAQAVGEHYRPRFAGDELPKTKTGQIVALADKLDTLAGIFGIGQQPTGEKDPFALRRAALGVVRILIEKKLPLSLYDLIDTAFSTHGKGVSDAHLDLETFILDRTRGYFLEQGYTANEVESVLTYRPVRLDMIPAQLEAVSNYNHLSEAASLSAANKRISNILKNLDHIPSGFDESLFKEKEEKALAKEYLKLKPKLETLFNNQEFTPMLQELAILKEPVDAFFDKVMVMTDDETLRNNRIGLLNDLRQSMNRVADLSKLAT
ncbi:MAG TPA: glycine--tRNA ligase subunit beta [Gammaproteobacteria bacterium]